MSRKVALIGAGAMGGAIGQRLVETGLDLCVVRSRSDQGGGVGRTRRTRGSKCWRCRSAIRSRHPQPQLSEDCASRGLRRRRASQAGAKSGTLIIDMSSIDPEATRELAADAADKGLRWVDTRYRVGHPKALIGALTLMAGGANRMWRMRMRSSNMSPPTSPIWVPLAPDKRRSSSTRCCAD